MPDTPSPSLPSSRFARLAGWSYAHRWYTIGLWILTLVVVSVASSAVGTKDSNDFRLPGTESNTAYELLDKHSKQQTGDVDQFVFHAEKGKLTDEATRTRIDKSLAQVAKANGVARVTSPFVQGGQLSKDKTIGVAQVLYTSGVQDQEVSDLKAVQKKGFEARGPTLQVEHGGFGAQTVRFHSQGGDPSLAIGFGAAAIVLILTFGALLAAGTTLITALISLGTTIGLIAFTSQVINTPDFASQLAELIGLGVGVDYALFVLTRYRSEVRAGRERAEAIVVAMDTAGRTVFFAACTVIIALLGLLTLGLGFMQGVAIASAMAVLLTMFAALTLLPAFVRVFGDRIDGFFWARRLFAKMRGGRPSKRGEGKRWGQWAGGVQRRPVIAAVLSGALLIALAIPATNMRLGSADAGVDPASATTKKAYDLVADGFGAGVNGQFLIATKLAKPGDAGAAQQLASAIARDPQMTQVGKPAVSKDGQIATISAYPKTGPQDKATTDTLKRLRDDVIPPIEKSTGAKVYVGGQTAATVDFTDAVASKLPLFVGVVVLLSALLLMCVFRSIVIPVKAAIMNLLSIGAALGILTLVFQEGHGASAIDVATGPIESFFPVMLFAIVFGLSMDYEVFLVSRMHEEWTKSGDAREASRIGLATTGKVITAAATIMIVVFAAFVIGDDRVIKMFGIGLASAIFLDAFVIRSVLVPAIMELLGEKAWYMPAWLDRVLPRLALENPDGHQTHDAPRATNRPATDLT